MLASKGQDCFSGQYRPSCVVHLTHLGFCLSTSLCCLSTSLCCLTHLGFCQSTSLCCLSTSLCCLSTSLCCLSDSPRLLSVHLTVAYMLVPITSLDGLRSAKSYAYLDNRTGEPCGLGVGSQKEGMLSQPQELPGPDQPRH